MRRAEVVQSFLDLFTAPRYLEIGVDFGDTFHELRASSKVAVDPQFKFDANQAQAKNLNSKYHSLTSDQFFEGFTDKHTEFDVIYIDGLHTYEQTLRDLMNAIVFLPQDGIIIIDDVIPSSYSASLPVLDDVFFLRRMVTFEAADGSWMGDVYKLVFFVAAFLQQFSYATVSDNHGQLVLWRSARNVDSHRLRTVRGTGEIDFLAALKEEAIFNRLPCSEILRMVQTARN